MDKCEPPVVSLLRTLDETLHPTQIFYPAVKYQMGIRLATRCSPQGTRVSGLGVAVRRAKNLVQMQSFSSIVGPKLSLQRPVTCVHLPVMSSSRLRVREDRLGGPKYGRDANVETAPCRCNALQYFMAFRVTKPSVHRQLEAPSLTLMMCVRGLRLSAHRV